MRLLLLGLVFMTQINMLGLGQSDTLRSDARQTEDPKEHDPITAAILSARLPGLGQVYNRKYWKVPIVYAGLATSIYFVDFNTGYYQTYRDAYILRVDGDSSTIDDFPFYTETNIKDLMDYYHRNLELSYIATGVIYLLNILDATVDGHLFDFDIQDDLSLRFEPSLIAVQNQTYPGISFKFSFSP